MSSVVQSLGSVLPTLALIGFTAVLVVFRGASRPPRSLILIGTLTLCFVLYAAIGAVLGRGQGGIDKVIRIALFAAWGIMIAYLVGTTRRATILALVFLFLAAFLVALASVPTWVHTGVPSVFSVNRIVFGRSIGVGAVVALAAALVGHERRSLRLLALLAGMFLAIVTLASASRGAFVSLFVALLIVVLSDYSHGVRRRWAAGAVLAGLGVTVVFVAQGSFGVERLSSLLSSYDLTSVLRDQAVQYSLQQWQSSPIFGVGLRNLDLIVGSGSFAQVVAYPHNMIVELLAQTGMVGLLMVTAAFASVWWIFWSDRTMRTDSAALGLVGAWMFFLVSAQFSGDLDINRYVWTFAFLIVACQAWSLQRLAHSPSD